jgi:uncharacterized membrane protein AbrB (regulator of aidB expression)
MRPATAAVLGAATAGLAAVLTNPAAPVSWIFAASATAGLISALCGRRAPSAEDWLLLRLLIVAELLALSVEANQLLNSAGALTLRGVALAELVLAIRRFQTALRTRQRPP